MELIELIESMLRTSISTKKKARTRVEENCQQHATTSSHDVKPAPTASAQPGRGWIKPPFFFGAGG
mgnify:CR=1 FL=1